MAVVPKLQLVSSSDSSIIQLQANIQTALGGFVPIAGGALGGTLTWAAGQQFPSTGVTIANPAYPHSNVWATLADHINDGTVHRVPGLPLAHASSHIMGGSDLVFGDGIAINAANATTSIKSYVDTAIAGVVAPTANYAPATYYAISGAHPLYASAIAINAANPLVDVVSYVNTQIASQVAAGGGSTTPSYTGATLTGTTGLVFTGHLKVSAAGVVVLSTDGVNTAIVAASSAGSINLGTATSPTAYGSLSASGYLIGNTSIGSGGAVIGGAVSVQGDLQVSRQAAGHATQGEVQFGTGTQAVVSYNVDVANSFYVSQPITLAGALLLQAGAGITLAGSLNISSVSQHASTPGIRSDGTNASLYAMDGGSILLGVDNATLTNVRIGPSSNWCTIDSVGVHVGSTVITATGEIIGGAVTAQGALASQQTTTTGLLQFGVAATGGSIDFGNIANGYFTLSHGTTVAAQIKPDGTYLVGSTSYGPTLATVTGNVAATQNISAGLGLNYNSTSGYSFTGVADVGMFSTGEGDLRLVTNGAVAIDITPTLISFNQNLSVGGAITATTLGTTGAIVAGSDLTISGRLFAGTSTISKFRVKGHLSLGYIAGTVSTANVYPNTVVINLVSGQIEGIWLSVVTADTTATQTAFNILQNGTVIGSVTLTNGALTSFAYPIRNPAPIRANDQIHAVCTTAGTSTGAVITLEYSQFML